MDRTISKLFKQAPRLHPKPELWERIARNTVSSEWRIPEFLEGASNPSLQILAEPLTSKPFAPKPSLALPLVFSLALVLALALIPFQWISSARDGRKPAAMNLAQGQESELTFALAQPAAGEPLIDGETWNWLADLGENNETDEVLE